LKSTKKRTTYILVGKSNKMEERAIDQLRIILERQGVKIDAIETLENTEKALKVKLGNYTAILSRKQKLSDKDVAGWLGLSDGDGGGEVVASKNAILVTMSKPSANVESVIRNYLVRGNIRLYFHLRELQFDITKHRMFPPHFLFNDAFKKANTAVTEQFNRFRMKTPEEELPRMDCLDIGARLVGALPGDVVYIQRYSDTGGYVPYWRRVVADANVDQ